MTSGERGWTWGKTWDEGPNRKITHGLSAWALNRNSELRTLALLKVLVFNGKTFGVQFVHTVKAIALNFEGQNFRE